MLRAAKILAASRRSCPVKAVAPRYRRPLRRRLHDRRTVLDGLFTRRLAEAEPTNDGRWRIIVRPFDKAEMHVDPRLSEGLAWWDPRTRLTDMPYAVRRKGASQLSLEDAWTALSWSHWLRSHGTDAMTILHVDDHDDLMAPLLTLDHGDASWTDIVTGDPVRLADPDSVTAAVNSAAIGVAGFFTPFVHEVSNGEIRHLCATRYSRTRTQRLGVSAEFVAEDRTFPAHGSRRCD